MAVAWPSPTSPRGLTAAPILKWAGGKRQLLPEIRRFYPLAFTRYVEPFVGSGAVFFDLARLGLLAGKSVVLMDSNEDLIGCYRAVRDHVDDLVLQLRELEHGHRIGGSAFFYEVRDTRFNVLRQLPAGRTGSGRGRAVELAAMLIYLNRTCFNGLYRLNTRGEFNTPAGRYTNPTICDEPNLRAASAVLAELQVDLRAADFSTTPEFAGPEAFVYFDPPYVPISPTASFTSYTAARFTEKHQEDLRDLTVQLASAGSHVLLSNSVAPLTTRLFERSPKSRRAGLRAHRVAARRAINCDGSSRGTVEEYLVSNVPRAASDAG